MSQISIIVPVFRAEKNLHRCIDSILAQTHTNFELILVDDGSPDNSGIICDEYAMRDSRVHVIHKQNNGVSAARNSGLDVAQGDYISFIDSDDYVDIHYLEKLISAQSDFSVCGSYIVSESKAESVYISTKECRYDVTPERIADWFDNHYLKYVWGKLFKRTIIELNSLRFDSRISLGEDTVFAVQYALLCKTFVSISDPLYYYVKYPSGTLTKLLTPHVVISNDLRDQVLGDIFRKNSIESKLFHTPDYVSKQKMKHTFFAVFESSDMSIAQKYQWYRLFWGLPLYINNTDILSCDCSTVLRWVINKKSPTLLILFQMAAKVKAMILPRL